jgi:hypothetical protein
VFNIQSLHYRSVVSVFFMEELQIKHIYQNFPYKMSGNICMGKIKKRANREIYYFQKRKNILPIGDWRLKDENSIFLTRSINPNNLGSFEIFTSKMVKIVISYLFTGKFFQTENIKCKILELNRLIGCQSQK